MLFAVAADLAGALSIIPWYCGYPSYGFRFSRKPGIVLSIRKGLQRQTHDDLGSCPTIDRRPPTEAKPFPTSQWKSTPTGIRNLRNGAVPLSPFQGITRTDSQIQYVQIPVDGTPPWA